MLEALYVRSGTIGGLMNQTTSTTLVTGASNTWLSGGIWEDDGTLYMYGGFNESYTPMNTVYGWAPPSNTGILVGDGTGNLTFKLDATTVMNGKPVKIGRMMYLFGATTNNIFAVKIINLDTKISRTVVSAISAVTNAPVTDGTQFGADFDGNRTVYIKRYGLATTLKFDTVTEAFTVFTTTGPSRFGSAEFVLCGGDALYFMGGWNNTTSQEVYRLEYAGGTPVQHDTLPIAGTSINQGYVTRNRKFYYITWTGSQLLVNCYEPGTKRYNTNPFNTGLTYRNCCCIGNVSDGMVFAGGTSIAQGGSNWKTAGRINATYRVVIKE